jgi:hypothetical protein
LCCPFSLSPCLYSTPAVLRPSFHHSRPPLHGLSRPQKRSMCGNPAPESLEISIVRIVSRDLNPSGAFRLPCARAPRRWPDEDQEGSLPPSVLLNFPFGLSSLRLPETLPILCKRFTPLPQLADSLTCCLALFPVP